MVAGGLGGGTGYSWYLWRAGPGSAGDGGVDEQASEHNARRVQHRPQLPQGRYSAGALPSGFAAGIGLDQNPQRCL